MQRERVDLQSFKDKLKLVLNDNAASYWDCLKKFTQAKLTKKELDQYAQTILVTSENIALHNLFIQSILNNAMCALGPHTSVPPVAAAAQLPASPQLELERSYAGDVSASGLKKQKPAKRKKHGGRDGAVGQPAGVHRAAAASEPLSVASKAVLTASIVHTPHLLALRNRMHVIASEHGASHVANEAVVCVAAALEAQLKQLLLHVRLQPTLPPPSAAAAAASATQQQHVQVLTGADLLATIGAEPHLLGSTFSRNLERVLATLQD
eukprot:TRINITY_DN20304_c0_g1_i1.p1 TRINITY_DN20304_c0_g1~~TRINITY_DN20304_c0_g1_i1.p1  ORF type:complete len:266 (+),score=86.09 TRINITY_DN20304_c0_g1_i1:236-1033(+)